MWVSVDGKPHWLVRGGRVDAAAAPVWEDIKWMRPVGRPIIVKGVTSVDDARAMTDEGAAAIIISNHGGRALDGAPATPSVLPNIARAVGSEVEVLMDGGVRHGSEAVKAWRSELELSLSDVLTFGEHAAAGEAGVRKVLTILRNEIETTLRLLGCESVDLLDQVCAPPPEWIRDAV